MIRPWRSGLTDTIAYNQQAACRNIMISIISMLEQTSLGNTLAYFSLLQDKFSKGILIKSKRSTSIELEASAANVGMKRKTEI